MLLISLFMMIFGVVPCNSLHAYRPGFKRYIFGLARGIYGNDRHK